jgi:hypothetical protein
MYSKKSCEKFHSYRIICFASVTKFKSWKNLSKVVLIRGQKYACIHVLISACSRQIHTQTHISSNSRSQANRSIYLRRPYLRTGALCLTKLANHYGQSPSLALLTACNTGSGYENVLICVPMWDNVGHCIVFNLVPRVCLFAGYVHYITREQAYSGNEIV